MPSLRARLDKPMRPPNEVSFDDFTKYFPFAPAALCVKECARLTEIRRYDCPGPILDVGCGDGLFARIAFKDAEIWGIDVDAKEGGWALASRAYTQIILGDIARAKLPQEFFATCIANCSLEHVPDLDAALATIRGSLEPGGRAYLFVPNRDWASWFASVRLLRALGLEGAGRCAAGLGGPRVQAPPPVRRGRVAASRREGRPSGRASGPRAEHCDHRDLRALAVALAPGPGEQEDDHALDELPAAPELGGTTGIRVGARGVWKRTGKRHPPRNSWWSARDRSDRVTETVDYFSNHRLKLRFPWRLYHGPIVRALDRFVRASVGTARPQSRLGSVLRSRIARYPSARNSRSRTSIRGR